MQSKKTYSIRHKVRMWLTELLVEKRGFAHPSDSHGLFRWPQTSRGCLLPWLPSPGVVLTSTHGRFNPSLAQSGPHGGAQCPSLGLSPPALCLGEWARPCPATPGEPPSPSTLRLSLCPTSLALLQDQHFECPYQYRLT